MARVRGRAFHSPTQVPVEDGQEKCKGFAGSGALTSLSALALAARLRQTFPVVTLRQAAARKEVAVSTATHDENPATAVRARLRALALDGQLTGFHQLDEKL